MIINLRVEQDKNGYQLRDFLRSCGVSAAVIKCIKYQDGFFINGQSVHTNARVCTDNIISFDTPQDKASAVIAEALKVCISYESEHSMVIDKPAGMAVHPTLNYEKSTLANAYIDLMQKRGKTAVFRPINRLDVNTSGLVLCAQNMLSADFLAENVTKSYFAIVQKELPLGNFTINEPIALAQNTIIKRCVDPKGKASITQYQTLCANNGHSLVKVMPLTGRTHQIRVHFAFIGAPLAGDDLYGGSQNIISRHALHCGEMEFSEPFCDDIIKVYAELPQDIKRAMHALQLSAKTDKN